jgi:hypothetical protein
LKSPSASTVIGVDLFVPAAQVRPATDGERLQAASVHAALRLLAVLSLALAEVEMDVGKDKIEAAGPKGGEVGIAIEAFELPEDAREPDAGEVFRRHRDPADLIQQLDLLGVIEEDEALAVSAGI